MDTDWERVSVRVSEVSRVCVALPTFDNETESVGELLMESVGGTVTVSVGTSESVNVGSLVPLRLKLSEVVADAVGASAEIVCVKVSVGDGLLSKDSELVGERVGV